MDSVPLEELSQVNLPPHKVLKTKPFLLLLLIFVAISLLFWSIYLFFINMTFENVIASYEAMPLLSNQESLKQSQYDQLNQQTVATYAGQTAKKAIIFEDQAAYVLFSLNNRPERFNIVKAVASPDSSALAVIGLLENSIPTVFVYHITSSRFEYSGHLAATTLQDIINNPELVWSPDSKKLAFLTSAADADCNSGIVVFDVDLNSSIRYEYQSNRLTDDGLKPYVCHSNITWQSPSKIRVDYVEYEHPETGRILDSELGKGTGIVDLTTQDPSY